MIIDCISDLHGNFPKLSGGDILIVAGDLTARDSFYEHVNFIYWLELQSYDKKIWISGNHDRTAEAEVEPYTWTINEELIYLCDSGTEYKNLKIWGSPWTKTFKGINSLCTAFTLENEKALDEKWDLIPDDIDILITHSPPFGILDKTLGNFHVGSTSLLEKVTKVKPALHVFGHIHESYGKKELILKNNQGLIENKKTTFINASHVNEKYAPVNKPMRIIL